MNKDSKALMGSIFEKNILFFFLGKNTCGRRGEGGASGQVPRGTPTGRAWGPRADGSQGVCHPVDSWRTAIPVVESRGVAGGSTCVTRRPTCVSYASLLPRPGRFCSWTWRARPPSHQPLPCGPLSNRNITHVYAAALSPRSARAGSDAFPYSILSARSIRPLHGLLMRDCHARAPRLALYIHIALVRFSFRAPISPTYQPNLAARSRGLLDVGAFGGPCKAGRAWLVLESEACYTSPSIWFVIIVGLSPGTCGHLLAWQKSVLASRGDTAVVLRGRYRGMAAGVTEFHRY